MGKVRVMPFQSQAQRRFLYATDPKLAKEFEAATPKGAKLPEHVKKKKRNRAMLHDTPTITARQRKAATPRTKKGARKVAKSPAPTKRQRTQASAMAAKGKAGY